MARGGKRDGAGRPKGAPNKASAERAAAVAESGQTPVDFMLEVMRDRSKEHAVRLDAAKAVAPYIHPKLANIEHTGKGGGAININITQEDAAL